MSLCDGDKFVVMLNDYKDNYTICTALFRINEDGTLLYQKEEDGSYSVLARQNDRYISAETTDKLPPHQFSLINNVLCSDTYAEGYCCEHKTENRDFIGHTGAITAHRCRNFYANVKTGGCA
ncbi:hypothetical protein [Treponema vincentii]|uniref:hypothetical protein n=1 Tax=Treponema vincentii TaxID=69710 RepID=UPI0020A2722A|nr:hypothetical protein [Treponema vincentii]